MVSYSKHPSRITLDTDREKKDTIIIIASPLISVNFFMKIQIKNLEKAAKRISKAIKKKENIIIYGDADLDGVSSSIILEETIKNLGGKVADIYFPDREKEGYGLTETSLDYLKKYSPALLIVLDCGISNFKEIDIANKIGLEVIVVDHHEVLDKLPKASIIVDPKQKGDRYLFKDFANVGLTFKLSEVLLKKKMTESLRKDFLELVALATIADMVVRTDENETMIIEGLSSLESSWRPGIQALFKLKELSPFNLMERVYKVNSMLNIRDVENRMPASFRILTISDEKEAEKLVKELFEKSIEKKERIREIKEEIETRISRKPSSPIIFEGDSKWELVFLGVAASLLVRDYKKPVFLHKKQEGQSQGSIRAPSGFNVVESMKTCSKKLITYGGHPKAAGFRVKKEDLEEFEECLIEYFNKL